MTLSLHCLIAGTAPIELMYALGPGRRIRVVRKGPHLTFGAISLQMMQYNCR